MFLHSGGIKDVESQSEDDNSPNSLRCCCDLSLHSLSPSVCRSQCILIPPPEAVVSRQPIKTLPSVCASVSCILGAFFLLLLFISLIHPTSPRKVSNILTNKNTFSGCFIFGYVLLHSCQHVLEQCLQRPRCFPSNFSNSFHSTLFLTMLSPNSMWV